MREYDFLHAIRQALREEMRRDPNVFLIGEDIARHGGPYGTTQTLVEEFGEERLVETPIIEAGFFAAAVGAAMMGMRPVPELMTADNITLCLDQLVHAASHYHYLVGVPIPLTLRGPIGGGLRFAASHEKSLEAYILNVPGLKVVYPATPYDAYGLLKTSIRDNNAVVFFEHKMIYYLGYTSQLPDEEFTIPMGVADRKREGRDLTIITWGWMVHRSLAAAEMLSREDGIEAEVLDLRTLNPLDREAIIAAVKRTNKVAIVHEAPKTGGFGGELTALIQEQAFDYLDAPVLRVAAPDIPIGFSPTLQDFFLPDEQKIAAAVRQLARKRRTLTFAR